MNEKKLQTRTKGQLAFDMISYLLDLQHKIWSEEKEKAFKNEASEEWVSVDALKQKLQEKLAEAELTAKTWKSEPITIKIEDYFNKISRYASFTDVIEEVFKTLESQWLVYISSTVEANILRELLERLQNEVES